MQIGNEELSFNLLQETPQQNSPVEKKFDTIAGRSNSMMDAENLSLHDRCKLFKEAFKTATLLDELVLIIKKKGREREKNKI